MYSVLIVDNNEFARLILKSALQEIFNDLSISEASSISEATKLINKTSFNLALVDISLPDGSGIDLINTLATITPQTYIVVVTIHDDDEDVFASLKAGANGYMLKDLSFEEMQNLLHGIMKGQPPLSPSIARRILAYFRNPTKKQNHVLTHRETEVLLLIGNGYKRSEVANMLGISSNTAAEHIHNIYQKLNINSRAEAALEACRMGLIDPQYK